ncbi:MAG TPA: hypothetical protein VJU61_09325 [Polyangiaceae bacterium]|nr:hypothetical protein [Polyangiaceae bacterium]
MPKSARPFLDPLVAELVGGIFAVAEAQRLGKIEIGADGCAGLPD